MWVVLDAQPDAAIIYGLSETVDGGQFSKALSSGNLEPYLNKVSIKAGDHVCVPSRTLHAILEGTVIVEIQQNSNTTYRVYDWDRVGKDGNPRELHVDKALEVINFKQVRLNLPKAVQLGDGPGYHRELLCQNEYFTTERFHLKAGENLCGSCDGRTLEIWGVLSGGIVLNHNPMQAIGFVLLPAVLGSFEIKALENSVLLRSYTK
jgi:mannose-6-phosphate isomerase